MKKLFSIFYRCTNRKMWRSKNIHAKTLTHSCLPTSDHFKWLQTHVCVQSKHTPTMTDTKMKTMRAIIFAHLLLTSVSWVQMSEMRARPTASQQRNDIVVLLFVVCLFFAMFFFISILFYCPTWFKFRLSTSLAQGKFHSCKSMRTRSNKNKRNK